MHQFFYSDSDILYPSRCTVLIGNDPYLLTSFQAVLYQLQNIAMLPRQCFSVDNDHADIRIITAIGSHGQFSLIFRQAIIIHRSRNIFLDV